MIRAKDPGRINKFQYKNLEGITPPPGSPSTGWSFSDAIIQRDCPRCGCSAGFACQTPAGRKCNTPHCERVIVTEDHKRPAVRQEMKDRLSSAYETMLEAVGYDMPEHVQDKLIAEMKEIQKTLEKARGE